MLDNPVLHRILTSPPLYAWLASAAAPFLGWAILVRVSRNYPHILQRAYPVVKVLALSLWFANAGCFCLYALYAWPTKKLLWLISLVLIGLSGATNIVFMKLRRRVDPDSFKKHEGWWPTPKDSSPLP
jgi:hypothetical protein